MEQVHVRGYPRVLLFDENYGVEAVFVVPRAVDLLSVVSGPGVTLELRPREDSIDGHRVFVGIGNSILAPWRTCGIVVSEVLPAGLADFEGRLPNRITDEVRSRSSLITIWGVCGQA
jgi:hypothetical protein